MGTNIGLRVSIYALIALGIIAGIIAWDRHIRMIEDTKRDLADHKVLLESAQRRTRILQGNITLNQETTDGLQAENMRLSGALTARPPAGFVHDNPRGAGPAGSAAGVPGGVEACAVPEGAGAGVRGGGTGAAGLWTRLQLLAVVAEKCGDYDTRELTWGVSISLPVP